MAKPEETRRRFAPVPIETTFHSTRKGPQQHQIGPNPELTPEPSPRSPSPVPQELRPRRRFAPQLIETSRRSRRVGNSGPATRPTDKTDITPYTKHIYAAKPRGRRRHDGTEDDEPIRPSPPTRRESEEKDVQEYFLDLAAKEAERQIQEAALAAFPNSRAREGGVAHFYFRESSGSENSPEGSPKRQSRGQSRVRRKSSDVDLGWWQKHMQQHAEHLAYERTEDVMLVDEPMLPRTDSDLDRMDFSVPPDALWTTNKRASAAERKDPTTGLESYPGGSLQPLLQRDLFPPIYPHQQDRKVSATSAPRQTQQDAAMGDSQHAPATQQAPRSPFGKPFGGFAVEQTPSQKMRQVVSPPMLGKDLTFRTCPSPKLTKMEPDHAFLQPMMDEQRRDFTGQAGLWRGYCFRSESKDGYLVPAELHGPAMMDTPFPPATPMEIHVPGSEPYGISQEPDSFFSSTDASGATSEHRLKNGDAKGVHMLHGLDERLRREKAQAERDEKIAQEFDDDFVTQVYNYLSLGYPATARSFDDELCKISRIPMEELEKDDEKQMAKGHMVEITIDDVPEEDKCPRWKALRIYITEWARQHPDLDNLDPLAWGVRERRGSWAI
ncbi:hypothetical protein HJFPF1_08006 [Paramyrothecium foliicola]|nr:hypothetical protein HJFPF1_08006 [Paramyrothecium foliicola]